MNFFPTEGGGSAKFELLWTNPNPYDSMTNSKIYCDVASYDYILLVGAQIASYDLPSTPTNWYEGIRLLYKVKDNYNKGGAGSAYDMFFAYTEWRPVTLEADGITLGSGNKAVVRYIYGLKCDTEIA